MDEFGQGTESEMCGNMRLALHASEQKLEYYIDNDCVIYLKTA